MLKGPSERRVYGRGRPHACQGGPARAGQQAEPGWAGREGAQGRAGVGGQAASRSGQRTAGGAWNLADLALPRPPRHLGPSPTSWARAHGGGLHSSGVVAVGQGEVQGGDLWGGSQANHHSPQSPAECQLHAGREAREPLTCLMDTPNPSEGWGGESCRLGGGRGSRPGARLHGDEGGSSSLWAP